MILILQRGAIPNGEKKGRWNFLCPECGRSARELLPRPGEPHRPLQAAALGWVWAPWPNVSEVKVQARGPSVSVLGFLPWACRRCRGVPSEASRLDRRARAERHLEVRAADGRAGQRRPGESWDEELRRQQRAAAARRLVEASAMTRLGRVLDLRLPRLVR